jgi:hypothetical protein
MDSNMELNICDPALPPERRAATFLPSFSLFRSPESLYGYVDVNRRKWCRRRLSNER